MAGVVGGDVGTGTFTGEVLSFVQVGNVATIHAVYRFHGSGTRSPRTSLSCRPAWTQ